MAEELPFAASLALSEGPVPLAESIGLERRAVREGEAWGIDHYYERQLVEGARARGEPEAFSGPLRSGISFKLAIGDSTIDQAAVLEPGSRALRFRTRIDWREDRRLLRVLFPAAIRAREALCEIPFGQVARPTMANTEWDFAKFEFCAHRWVDLSDEDYGLALLNDCKYGYSARGCVLGLSLLRSPLYPDPEADRGLHELEYLLCPHPGPLAGSDAIEAAAALNKPPLAFAGRGPAGRGRRSRPRAGASPSRRGSRSRPSSVPSRSGATRSRSVEGLQEPAPQHFLYFLPLPQGH
ncbi:MAG TPA: glycoside hydrolase family 38 C-terminal domain-containing protein [Spirochaetales bacterium]|nr:glycoside hydrolase family 38 C-terminal domain-containing protein [Spirochaetales bacterium]HRY54131.1 glycoside hydrolase family 38 C-terminal domain-containing protein [Spirochaetia bacterium]HRZ63937.1 glycoside hydrolase family 38 C-terminal domain-containing protein [Spirochaetia bacterium]